MKLVIDSAHVREVTMVVAGIELPLSREQVVRALFGPDFEIVPIGSRSHPPKAKREKRAPVDEVKRTANGDLEVIATQVLADIGESSIQAIRAAILEREPRMFDGRRPEYLVKGLIRFVEKGVVQRVGEKGAFRYSLANAAPSVPTPAAPPSWGKKSVGDVVTEILSKRSVPLSTAELSEVIKKKYPGMLEGRSPSLLATTLSMMKITMKLIKATPVDGTLAYALVGDWQRVKARREKAAAASAVANGLRVAKAYKKKLREGKVKGRGKSKTKTKNASATQLEMRHLNGAAPAQTSLAEAVS